MSRFMFLYLGGIKYVCLGIILENEFFFRKFEYVIYLFRILLYLACENCFSCREF